MPSEPSQDSDSNFLREQAAQRKMKSTPNDETASDVENEEENLTADPSSTGRHHYVFDEWLDTSNQEEGPTIDIFGERARVPILFYTLIKILTQGILIFGSNIHLMFSLTVDTSADGSERYLRIARILFPQRELRRGPRTLADTASQAAHIPIQIGNSEHHYFCR